MVVLDTCAIIELCKESSQISEKTFKSIEKEACILSISFAEIACKIKAEKLYLNISAEDLFLKYKEIPSVKIIDIGVAEWLDSVSLNWSVKDPADRTIVAYAKKQGYSIVTSDKQIKKYYKKVLW